MRANMQIKPYRNMTAKERSNIESELGIRFCYSGADGVPRDITDIEIEEPCEELSR